MLPKPFSTTVDTPVDMSEMPRWGPFRWRPRASNRGPERPPACVFAVDNAYAFPAS